MAAAIARTPNTETFTVNVRQAAGKGDACVRSAPVSLTFGKRYELSGWVRTEDVRVEDSGRTPIAIGAALTMASMPFDVHSESVGGTHDWTRLHLRFVATRPRDSIVHQPPSGKGASLTIRYDLSG